MSDDVTFDVELDHGGVDVSALDDDQQYDIVMQGMARFVTELEAQGFSPDIVRAAVFHTFVVEMQDNCSREEFEEVLALALEQQWPLPPSLH